MNQINRDHAEFVQELKFSHEQALNRLQEQFVQEKQDLQANQVTQE